jgi:hypothetical protein
MTTAKAPSPLDHGFTVPIEKDGAGVEVTVRLEERLS